jgi:hypothetical protein
LVSFSIILKVGSSDFPFGKIILVAMLQFFFLMVDGEWMVDG